MTDAPKKRPPIAQKGEAPRNPTGKNGFSTGIQPYKMRAAHYLERYKPSEIIDIAVDPIKLDKLTSWDAIVVKRLAAAILSASCSEQRLEVEHLLNRLEGKPVERKEVRVIKGFGDLSEEELAALAGEGSAGEEERR